MKKEIVKSYLETSTSGCFPVGGGRGVGRKGEEETTSIRPITFDIVTRISVTPFRDLHSICIISVPVSSPSLSSLVIFSCNDDVTDLGHKILHPFFST